MRISAPIRLLRRCVPYMGALLLWGCGLRVALRSELDPTYMPRKTDAIAIVFPDNPTIQDRQLDPAMLRQFAASGFKIVPPNQATWIMGVSTQESTYFSGVKTIGVGYALPGLGGAVAVGVGSSEAEYASKVTIYCWLFPAKQYRQGQRRAAWMATETTTSDDFWTNVDTLAQGIISTYGENSYDDSAHIRKVKEK